MTRRTDLSDPASCSARHRPDSVLRATRTMLFAGRATALTAMLLIGSAALGAHQVDSDRPGHAALSGPSAHASHQTPDLRTIDGYVSAWVAAVRTYDVDRWAALVDRDVVMMAPNGRVIEGRDAFHELWARSFEGQSGTNPLHVEVIETRVGDDSAVLRADYGPIGADPVGQYVWVLERDADGLWSMAWWIFNRRPAG